MNEKNTQHWNQEEQSSWINNDALHNKYLRTLKAETLFFQARSYRRKKNIPWWVQACTLSSSLEGIDSFSLMTQPILLTHGSRLGS